MQTQPLKHNHGQKLFLPPTLPPTVAGKPLRGRGVGKLCPERLSPTWPPAPLRFAFGVPGRECSLWEPISGKHGALAQRRRRWYPHWHRSSQHRPERRILGDEPEEASPDPGELRLEEAAGARACRSGSSEGRIRVGARGRGRAGAAVSARPVRGCSPAHRAEEPSVQPPARPDGGRPAADGDENYDYLQKNAHVPRPHKKELQEQGEIRIIQLGFDLDAHGIVFTEDYRTRVLKACEGRPYAGAVQKFLTSVLPSCGDLSFQQEQMTQTFGFRDPEITHLVNAGVLTVRDAGSWWLAVPGAGRFIKYFVKGRQAVLGMIRKTKYRELLLSELLGRRAPAAVRLGLAYHVHDLIGAQLVDCVATTSGTLLHLPDT